MTDTTDAALDSWINWLEDLPFSKDFDEGLAGLQGFITALRAALASSEAASESHFQQAMDNGRQVAALRVERDAALIRERAAYARGVHDAAAWIEEVPNVLANRQEIARAIRAFVDAPPVPVVRVTEAAVLKAAVEEYTLDHPREKSEQRMGRRSAVRGMMIRLGLYPELEDAIDAALQRRMTAPELKPCPFCGGKPYLANVEMVGCAYVVCTDCRTQSDDMSKDRAITAWNARADLPATDAQIMAHPSVAALVEALEQIRDGDALPTSSSGGMPPGQYAFIRRAGPWAQIAIAALAAMPGVPE